MKEKFLHNSFFNYMRLMNRGVNATTMYKGKGVGEIILSVIATVLLVLVFACLETSSDNLILSVFGWSLAIYISCMICGRIRAEKPSALAIMPLGYKKRIVYAYLSSLAYCLIFIVCFFAFILLYLLVVGLIVWAFAGEWMFTVISSIVVQASDPLGIVFALFMFILTFGAAMLITYIKNKKHRLIAMFVFPALLEVFALLLINFSSENGGFQMAGDVVNNFQNLPLSWLWLTVFALISAAICAVSVYFAIKSERPKEF